MPELDIACEALAEAIAPYSESPSTEPNHRLWVADEHPLSTNLLKKLAEQKIYLTSNRIDQVERAQKAGINAFFSDFDLQHPEHSLNHSQLWHSIYFRVAKEKSVVHHVINSAANNLAPKGNLWLAGHKKEGTKTYLSKAEDKFGCKAHVKRGKDQLFVGHLSLFSQGEDLPEKNYSDLRQVEMSGSSYWTKPGLFGWNKVDSGSEFLIEILETLNLDLINSRVLDLGCGYGYLACRAANLGAKNLVATDNCAAAIAACKKNLEEYALKECEVIATSCADRVEGKFDLILCNPPFHSGFSTNSELHHNFLTAIRSKLKPDAQALVVVNQFLRLQDLCERNQLHILDRYRDNQRHFDLYRLSISR